MKKIIIIFLSLTLGAAPALAQTAKNRANIYSELDSLFADSGDTPITPADLREALKDITASSYNSLTDGAPGSGAGTVTSVGLSLPAIFTITNSPVTSSGTLSASFANQPANYVLAGPTSGSAAAPAPRLLVAADIPSLTSLYEVPLTFSGPLSRSVNAISIGNAAADGATRGAATFLAADFNDDGSGKISIDYANGQAASGSVNGFLSSANWTTFNAKVGTARVISTTAPLAGGGDLSADRTLSIADAAADGSTKGAATFAAADFDASSGLVSIDYIHAQQASASLNGVLSSTDWSTFSGKVATARTLSTTSPLAGGGDLSANRTLSIANAAADASTKGAATFTAADFNDDGSGKISIDYANGQAASGSVNGFVTTGTQTIAGDKTFSSSVSSPVVTDSGLTSGNVVVAGTGGLLGGSSFATSSASLFRLSTVTATNPSPVAGAQLQLVGADLAHVYEEINVFNNTATLYIERTNGTSASPAALGSTSVIGSISGGGYNGTGYSPAAAGMTFASNNAGNWTSSATGTKITFFTTLAGSLTQNSYVMDQDGSFSVPGLLLAGSGPTTLTDSSGKILAAALNTVTAAKGGFGADVSGSSGVPLFASGTATFTSTSGTGNFVRVSSPALTTPDIGTPSAGNLSNCTADGTSAVGFRNIPQNSQSTAYTTVLADAGKMLYHPSADTTARTWTIDSNANVAYVIGTTLTFVNDSSGGTITIAITSDTLVLAGAGTTGSRTLAANGIATATKIGTTRWIIGGFGLN